MKASQPSSMAAIPRAGTRTRPDQEECTLVEVSDSGEITLDFRSTDIVRCACPRLDISDMDTDQELLDSLTKSMKDTLASAASRSLVVRVTLSGRGVLCHSLRRPSFAEELPEEINQDWEGQMPLHVVGSH